MTCNSVNIILLYSILVTSALISRLFDSRDGFPRLDIDNITSSRLYAFLHRYEFSHLRLKSQFGSSSMTILVEPVLFTETLDL
jgi:hypothetical protein